MPQSCNETSIIRLTSRAGLSVEFNANGSLRRLDAQDVMLNLFLGNELEGGPANLYLRERTHRGRCTPLLGPGSPTRVHPHTSRNRWVGTGTWHALRYSVTLVLAESEPAWFWHIDIENTGPAAASLDLIHAQDIALAPYGVVRLNEYYVSQYVDHTPFNHPRHGWVVASRQNQAAAGKYPWCLIGALDRGVSFATDAVQVHGLATRAGRPPAGLAGDLPGQRLQHEHSLVAIQSAPLQIEPGTGISTGFFGRYVADHPAASSPADLDLATSTLALTEAAPVTPGSSRMDEPPSATALFSSAPSLAAQELDVDSLRTLFTSPWRHEERDESGALLSFFHGAHRHVVLRSKELQVQRPHGHLLRTGRHTTPDEAALTSTAWMGGVFHSMLTQGHVSINRFLSTVHSYLGLFRSHGQRVFAQISGEWQLLDVPSAFEMSPQSCRWLYRHAAGEIEVRSEALSDPHVLTLEIEVHAGAPTRFLITHHVALNGDDGSVPGVAHWWREGESIRVAPQAGTELARSFPQGSFEIAPMPGTRFEQVRGDELLFTDGQSRQQPFVCTVTAPATAVGLRLQGHLIAEGVAATLRLPSDQPLPALQIAAPAGSPLAAAVTRLADIVPWYMHNALVHYLSPRGLEQYSGGGWGTRDVCQGPVEMLLALGLHEPIRDLLLRVMSAQNADGDWPQWFMFFERERSIRAGDSHGDIVFWPLLALGQYLDASRDRSLLEERVPFFAAPGDAGAPATVWWHAQRALAVIDRRVIAGTNLAAYGHGDWNDALQPADPAMRDHLCSAWTVTLHHQTLVTLARALRGLGLHDAAAPLEQRAEAVQGDFQRLLMVDGVLTGYALFEQPGKPRCLLHPGDTAVGVHYSSLAMIHAILDDMLTPAQAREHLRLIREHMSGPDGVRLFDRPMQYHGGPQRFFQRAESAAYFGREIGLMYMHAHLRYAQALAHVGEADAFFHALCQANPIGIRELVPQAAARQANCYYSSSDAAFADRYQASAEYERVRRGTVRLDGGWRVYSSGAGIALALIMRRFLGLTCEAGELSIDPVVPPRLDGMRVHTRLLDHAVEVVYRVGSAGAGVQAVQINQHPLALTCEHNPYRRGAARIARAAFAAHLQPGGNVLTIHIA